MSDAKAAAPAVKRDFSKILLIAFAVINVAVVSFGAFLVFKSTIGWDTAKYTEEEATVELASLNKEADPLPLVYTMDKFTVNLDGVPQRTIRLEVNLQMLEKKGFEEVMTPDNRAKARDRIIKLLGEQNFNELESIQGKLFLKNKIAKEVNTFLKEGVVKDVYFSDFVVQ